MSGVMRLFSSSHSSRLKKVSPFGTLSSAFVAMSSADRYMATAPFPIYPDGRRPRPQETASQPRGAYGAGRSGLSSKANSRRPPSAILCRREIAAATSHRFQRSPRSRSDHYMHRRRRGSSIHRVYQNRGLPPSTRTPHARLGSAGSFVDRRHDKSLGASVSYGTHHRGQITKMIR